MKSILITVTNFEKYCKLGKAKLAKEKLKIVLNPHNRAYTKEELIVLGNNHEFIGIILGGEILDEEVLNAFPHLKIITRFGVGVDNVPLDILASREISLTNCPGINSTAVAELAASLILSLSRKISVFDNEVKQSIFSRKMSKELKGQTLGLMGFGDVSKELAKRMMPFFERVISYDPFVSPEIMADNGVIGVSFERIVAESDVLSLHIPATEATFHTINTEVIDRMKASSLIINTARGTIVDEVAIAAGLNTQKISGYGADVFSDDNFLALINNKEQVIITPYIAAETFDNYESMGVLTSINISRYLNKQELKHVVL